MERGGGGGGGGRKGSEKMGKLYPKLHSNFLLAHGLLCWAKLPSPPVLFRVRFQPQHTAHSDKILVSVW